MMGSPNEISLGKIERRRAVDEVHQAIREAILSRRFPPGMRLNVEELSSQLGVSLTPVRSAIQMLSAEGLVDVHSRSGTFVTTLTRRGSLKRFPTFAVPLNVWRQRRDRSASPLTRSSTHANCWLL